jgi:hypothetical protein
MALNLNSKIVTDGLVFAMDAANPKGINPSGCGGYNNAPQLIKNIVRPGDTITPTSNLKLGNLSYFTAFAIDYPESSFGGAAASRDGITPGYNVTSGSKEFQFGRSLHLWISRDDNGTPVTVKATTYDTYATSSEVDRFVSEYYQARADYKGGRYTFLVAGSHRDSNHSEAQYTALRDMGAPSNVNSIINFASPEWILVGRPGIGAGNGAWSFQNYSTNPDQVAHLNFGVPFQGNTSNYLSFDGSSETIDCGNPSALSAIAGTSAVSVEAWVNLSGYGSSGYGVITHKGYPWTWLMENPSNTMKIRFYLSNSGDVSCSDSATHALNTWYHFTGTYDGSFMRFYRNGVLTNSVAGSGTLGGASSNMVIGSYSGAYFSQGRIPVIKIYNKTLSAAEIQQNFNALRGRYGI